MEYLNVYAIICMEVKLILGKKQCFVSTINDL